jgi:hypothetical protein
MTRKRKHIFRTFFWGSVLVMTFIAGRSSTGPGNFNDGYDAAMAHISSTIERRMGELQPFYIYDIGYKFIPRGITLVSVKKIGEENIKIKQARVAK